MADTLLKVDGINVYYGNIHAVKDISFTVNAGEIVTLIGANGAGKSTTLRLLMNTIGRDAGSVSLLGVDNQSKDFLRVKQDIGIVLDESCLPETLTAREVGKLMALTYERWEPETFSGYLTRFSIPLDKANKDFSRGMKMKLALAVALSHRAKLLLLDEHTAALDPKTALKVLTLSARIVEENHLTTMMITHNMKDAIKYGNRLIMMHEGHVIYDVAGDEKKSLTVADLLQKFEEVSGGELANDRMLLS